MGVLHLGRPSCTPLPWPQSRASSEVALPAGGHRSHLLGGWEKRVRVGGRRGFPILMLQGCSCIRNNNRAPPLGRQFYFILLFVVVFSSYFLIINFLQIVILGSWD